MDDRLAMAVAHWAPRFTTNGVTAGDFDRIVTGISSWDQWCEAWSAVAAEHEQLGRDALAAGRTISAGDHLSQAAVYFHFARFLFVGDMHQEPGAGADDAGRAGRITCPLLAVMGKLDRLIPWQQAQRLVAEAGGEARLLLLEQGNHGCANVAPFHRQATADWAAERLAGAVSYPAR